MQACGSGGTTAGIALGNHLSGFGARVHAYTACDDEEYFYAFIDGLFADMGATPERLGKPHALPRVTFVWLLQIYVIVHANRQHTA